MLLALPEKLIGSESARRQRAWSVPGFEDT